MILTYIIEKVIMKTGLLFLLLVSMSFTSPGPAAKEFDLVVYGGTSSGVIAAYAAAREGLSVALLEPGHHLGGLTSSGLGSVDIGDPESVGGYAMEFFKRAGKYYGSDQPAFKIEPSVAEMIFLQMTKEAGVQVFYGSRLVENRGVVKKGKRIEKLLLENGQEFKGKIFIDASYEGDLMAWAKVPYVVGRESMAQYGESQAGVRPARSVKPMKATLAAIREQAKEFPYDNLFGETGNIGEADGKTQAYTFRLTLTTRADNKVPFSKPAHYNPARYEGLLSRIVNNKITTLDKICTIYRLPNDKTDINHLDLVNASHGYPDGSYALRDSIWQYHKDYEEGFLYFVANDPQVPEALRKDVARWGYAKDEFTDNGHWPRYLYIREARRMIGSYVMRQQDLWENAEKEDGIGMGSYFPDSHTIQRIINGEGRLLNEGGLKHIPYKPYEIPYGSLIPKASDCENLYTTICMSASHVAYTSLRMEPVYMIMGHAAGVAAAMAVKAKSGVQRVDVQQLRSRLQVQHQVLKYDFKPGAYQKPESFSGVVIDDLDAVRTGNWSNSTLPPFLLAGARIVRQSAEETASMTFSTELPKSGRYEVFILYAPDKRKSREVKLTVQAADGAKTLKVDMTRPPSGSDGWHSLGVYSFTAGKEAAVLFSNEGAGAMVAADAVRFLIQ